MEEEYELDLTGQESELAADEPADNPYLGLIEFALATANVRADNIDDDADFRQKVTKILSDIGIEVPEVTEWSDLMSTGDKASFMKGVTGIADFVQRNPEKFNIRQAQLLENAS